VNIYIKKSDGREILALTAAEVNEWLASLPLPEDENFAKVSLSANHKEKSMQLIIDLDDHSDCSAAVAVIFNTHPGLARVPDDEPAPAMPSMPSAAGPETATDPKIGVETDSRGVPWLEAVHAGTKGKNNDGSWKKKRGVDAKVVEAAEAEALAELGATPDPVIPEEGPTEAAPPGAVLPGAAAPAATLPGAVPPPAAAPVSYQDVVDLYVEASNAGVIDEASFMALYEKHGTNFDDAQVNETARAGIAADLKALLA
jgi:hypothetical protein